MPVVRYDSTGDNREPVVHCMRWGLVPSFTKKSEKPDFYRMVSFSQSSMTCAHAVYNLFVDNMVQDLLRKLFYAHLLSTKNEGSITYASFVLMEPEVVDMCLYLGGNSSMLDQNLSSRSLPFVALYQRTAVLRQLKGRSSSTMFLGF